MSIASRSLGIWKNLVLSYSVHPGLKAPQWRKQYWQALATASLPESVPYRKILKDEAKKKRFLGKVDQKAAKNLQEVRLKTWELTVGIEVHAQLNTERKLFSSKLSSPLGFARLIIERSEHFDRCGAQFSRCAIRSRVSWDAAGKSMRSPVVEAMLTAPQEFQKATLIPALRAAVALNCHIQRRSRFDRKHYFYPDQPAGYQITQYYGTKDAFWYRDVGLTSDIEPFAKDGSLTLYDHDGIASEDGESVTIGIKQIQMEQDTAKTIQQPPSTTLLDFNRVSHPLIEIITLPHIHHPQTAAACVKKIQAMLDAVSATFTGMEMGGLRADVNVSVRRRKQFGEDTNTHSYHGVSGLGQRTEIKNLSSFKAVEDAIIAERDRQIQVLESGGVIEGETRGWSLGSTETTRLRGKEGEVDYRYMPDPDLAPVVISQVRFHFQIVNCC